MTNEEKQKLEEFKKGYREWLETNDVSIKDSLIIIWWNLFNKRKFNILLQGYFDGLSFWAAKKNASK